MSAAKHTPGPWEFATRPDSGGVSRPVVTHGMDLICAVSRRDGNDAESESNARLIAAAPELLEVMTKCEALLASITSISTDLAPFRDSVLRQARAAIARAEGKS